MKNKLIIGTRSSKLALWQSEYIKSQILQVRPDLEVELKHITTKGDTIIDKALNKIGDKGLFTEELEKALLDFSIDFAVHSLKDLQTELPEGLLLSAVSERHPPEDALIGKNPEDNLDNLVQNAKIASGSLRRKAQLLRYRNDFVVIDIRGNVPTRIEKFLNSDLDGLILARAGLERLGLGKHISSILSTDIMLPAVGQGALAVEINIENELALEISNMINHIKTYREISAERAFLKALGGGCHNPIAAYAKIRYGHLSIEGMVSTPNGKHYLRHKISGKESDAELIGVQLATELINRGADKILGL